MRSATARCMAVRPSQFPVRCAFSIRLGELLVHRGYALVIQGNSSAKAESPRANESTSQIVNVMQV
jgi:hypothetical protein